MTRGSAEGSGTVLVLAVVAVLLSVAIGLSMLSGVVLARRQAEIAADLAALAAAQQLLDTMDAAVSWPGEEPGLGEPGWGEATGWVSEGLGHDPAVIRCGDQIEELARQLAQANRAQLISCRQVGGPGGPSVEVSVQVPLRGVLADLGPARASARAGSPDE